MTKYSYINILGEEWSIIDRDYKEDSILSNSNGYTDVSNRTIVIADRRDDFELSDFTSFRNRVLRHEIIHAFLFESGLGSNFSHDNYGHDEEFIDWFAFQSPKIYKVYEELNCL